MDLLERIASFLFEKSTERVIRDSTYFDVAKQLWVGLVRTDCHKNRIKWEVQEHFRGKENWKVVHTGKATMKV